MADGACASLSHHRSVLTAMVHLFHSASITHRRVAARCLIGWEAPPGSFATPSCALARSLNAGSARRHPSVAPVRGPTNQPAMPATPETISVPECRQLHRTSLPKAFVEGLGDLTHVQRRHQQFDRRHAAKQFSAVYGHWLARRNERATGGRKGTPAASPRGDAA